MSQNFQSGSELRKDLVRIAEAAATLSLGFYEKTGYELKEDNSLVTEADRSVERFLQKELIALIPEAVFIGEEERANAEAVERARKSEWVFAVDPIDGTTMFVDGVGTYTISIGVLRNHLPFAGVVAVPALSRMYSAAKGEGAYYQDQKIFALLEPPERNRAAIYVNSTAHRNFDILFRGKMRSLGSTALHYLMVAKGVALGALAAAHVWDYVGAAAIVEEAGGVLRHLDGTEIDWPQLYDGSTAWPPVLGAPKVFWDEIAASIRPKPRKKMG